MTRTRTQNPEVPDFFSHYAIRKPQPSKVLSHRGKILIGELAHNVKNFAEIITSYSRVS